MDESNLSSFDMAEPIRRGPGRPKGSKDKKWASVSYWYTLIEENMHVLSAKEKVSLGKWGCEILIGKLKQIDTPDESKANVEDTMRMLKEMENQPPK